MARRRNRGMVGAAIRVMVVGIPNVGKSTFHQLLRRHHPRQSCQQARCHPRQAVDLRR